MGSDEPLVGNAEAELIALQRNFDDYIASSRELEEELEQEVSRLQKKLNESSASNAALVSRLESVTPQLLLLEQEIQLLRSKVEEEVILRRRGEQEQDKADSARRAAESTVQRLQEENDSLHEELAFQSAELEEARNESSETMLRQEEEIRQLRNDLQQRTMANDSTAFYTDAAKQQQLPTPYTSLDSICENDHEGKDKLPAENHETALHVHNNKQAEYIKSLEDE